MARAKKKVLSIRFENGQNIRIELSNEMRWFINTEEKHLVIGKPLEDPIFIANFDKIMSVHEMEV